MGQGYWYVSQDLKIVVFLKMCSVFTGIYCIFARHRSHLQNNSTLYLAHISRYISWGHLNITFILQQGHKYEELIVCYSSLRICTLLVHFLYWFIHSRSPHKSCHEFFHIPFTSNIWECITAKLSIISQHF